MQRTSLARHVPIFEKSKHSQHDDVVCEPPCSKRVCMCVRLCVFACVCVFIVYNCLLQGIQCTQEGVGSITFGGHVSK